MRKQENVHDVVDAQPQSAKAHQDVTAQYVSGQILCRIDIDNPTAHQSRTDVDGKQNEDGAGIAPHTLPLQEAGHGYVQRIDALQVAGAKQGQKHAGMQNAWLCGRYLVAEDGCHKCREGKDGIHPCQRQILYAVTGKESHHTSNDKVGHGRTAKCNEKQVFTHENRF